MAEIAFSAFSRQCLARRIGAMERLTQEAVAWQDRRNQEAIKIGWSFTTDVARAKLKNRYQTAQKIAL